jgi:hypothetical protein
MALAVPRRTRPETGVDIVDIILKEPYSVERIDDDTLLINGELRGLSSDTIVSS